jgi:hypothetical protein
VGERFEDIQRTLVPLWRSLTSLNTEEQTIIVLPSFSFWFPPEIAPVIPAYEERYLFLLFLLRQPRARMIYLTSRPVRPELIDYYLGLLPGVIPSHARARLHMVTVDDDSAVALTQKILDRPHVLEQIRALVPDRSRAHIIPFITSELERDIVERLGIPMYGADPRHTPVGTKAGSRKLFAAAGISYPLGHEDIGSITDAAAAVAAMRAERPDLRQVIVKLNEGISGLGNGIVTLDGDDLGACIRGMRLAEGTFDEFVELLGKQGGIVEERIEGEEIRSPSVQLRGTPLGELEILSTHDQLLGGPDGQVYFGCRFPADTAYAPAITRDAVKAGNLLIEEGVIGRFAIDFVVVRSGDGTWRTYAIELNLRKGGTTHPYLTLQFLTDGRYDAPTATFLAPDGTPKFFVATDHLDNPAYASLSTHDVFDVAVSQGLHFDLARQTGVVLHMLSALPFGRLGLTAVANSHPDAQALYERARAALDGAAGRSQTSTGSTPGSDSSS